MDDRIVLPDLVSGRSVCKNDVSRAGIISWNLTDGSMASYWEWTGYLTGNVACYH